LSAESVLRWLVAAFASAAALFVVVRFVPQATPIDAVMPIVGLLVTLVSSCNAGFQPAPLSIERAQAGSLRYTDFAVPLLTAAAFTIPDERLRLLTYGVIVAGAFAAALAFAPRTLAAQMTIAIAAIVILRWLPRPELWRELIVMVGAIAILLATRSRSPLAVIASVAIALLTPTHPGRVMLLPFTIALLVLAAPWEWRPNRLLLAPVYAGALALFALWPWSGLVARGFPAFLRAEKANDAQVIGRALRASESLEIPVDAKRGVVVTMSGMNVARMRGGRRVAAIDAGNVRREVRIGDVADFGFLRSDQWFRARNPLPRVPLDDIRGYGITAFLYGAGRLQIDGRVTSLRITAAPDLPSNAAIEVESVEAR